MIDLTEEQDNIQEQEDNHLDNERSREDRAYDLIRNPPHPFLEVNSRGQQKTTACNWKEVQELVKKKLRKNKSDQDEELCCICFQPLYGEDAGAIDFWLHGLCPNHKFHVKCMQDAVEKGHTDCPICRKGDEDVKKLAFNKWE